MAAATGAGVGRFAAACDALGRYVRASPASRPLPLMPGTDVNGGGGEERAPEAAPAPAPAQLTIFYGGRVLVLDDCPADKAAALLRLAARDGAGGDCGAIAASAPSTDLPVARKASLQRFMEKRKGRLAGAARAGP